MAVYYDEETRTLDFSYEDLTEFPCEIPDDCLIIYCQYNKLTKLPDDLKNVRHLECQGNELTELPDLKNVDYLFCYRNKLTSLPKLTNVECINCHSNDIKKMDIFNYRKFKNQFQLIVEEQFLYEPIHSDYIVKKIQRWYKACRLTSLGVPKVITYHIYGIS